MLGECIGVAFHPRDGLCRVFQSLDTTKLVVLVSNSGNRRFMRRELVQWRPSSKPLAQEAGSSTQGRAESAAQSNLGTLVPMFDLEGQ